MRQYVSGKESITCGAGVREGGREGGRKEGREVGGEGKRFHGA